MRPFLRPILTASLISAVAASADAQTIFSYGNKAVDKNEFLKAYNKNNSGEKPTDKSYRDYLELYTRFKVKVQAALDNHLDTLRNQQVELTSFRDQVAETYMSDETSVKILIDEVLQRSRKDVHIGHIFVALKENATPAEVEQATQKINKAYSQLQAGADFGQTALQYSEDPSVNSNKGDLGFITAFVLPYDLETLAYSATSGQLAGPSRSKIGFHIFKNLGERKAIGKMSMAQILLAFPPDATDEKKKEISLRAESIYKVLQKGADFSKLASLFSNDNFSWMQGGQMMEFGVGRYEPAFEAVAFGMKKDGEISKPVVTSFGYHILKRLAHKPVPDSLTRDQYEELRLQVEQSDRMNIARDNMYKRILKEIGFKKLPVNEKALWAYSDSILAQKNPPASPVLTEETPLFTYANETKKVKDWKEFLQNTLRLENMLGRPATQLMDEYIGRITRNFYRANLEQYNEDFAWQLSEFREGNLLFEIMQKNIWEVASADSVGLKKHYDAHKNNYWWEASADAIIFTAVSPEAAAEARKAIEKGGPKDWKKLIDASNGTLQADSGRFELAQIPVVARTNFTPKLITAPVKNETDNTTTFAYIQKVYRQREPRNFADARGFVINDYQTALEEKWVNELKKKYPIKINEEVVSNLPK